MFRRMKSLEWIVKLCAKVESGQHVLIITDAYARPIKVSQQIAELCALEGAEPVISIMEPRTHYGHEPPRSVAEAMKVADIIFYMAETYDITHTDAAKKVREKGIKSVLIIPNISEDYLDREISADDLDRIKECTERVAQLESNADEARIISSYGTDIKMSLKDRKGLPIHPLGGAAIITVPDYAEAAVSPVEGSTEGVLVVDASVQGWDFLLREPLKLAIKGGRITRVSGPEEYVERLNKLLTTDDNASNCAAELGIATSHTIPKDLRGGVWDYGIGGTIHIATGRNNDIGGETFSQIHIDFLVTKSSVWLDELCVLENGELKI
jgi:leucyl aminopeptidase (aminopeptidase T)